MDKYWAIKGDDITFFTQASSEGGAKRNLVGRTRGSKGGKIGKKEFDEAWQGELNLGTRPIRITGDTYEVAKLLALQDYGKEPGESFSVENRPLLQNRFALESLGLPGYGCNVKYLE